eukprot:CAMPEP_0181326608 /NCGR_PEP_ID=MMETSP1101-20121128/21603_1 /TAXON_ID=46948 /ORGANISM="Rhodomonas abbreviata, Strain Caron Lab Isolate" /LENGTH=131 /DNA_ID=CAMNT_0023435101 /DNA_START=6 /DNA_END=401 /DNA_ORIENTATION=-
MAAAAVRTTPAATVWAALVVSVLLFAASFREDAMSKHDLELEGIEPATQDYGPYYGPQAYYDGYYQTGGKAFASPYDRYERHRDFKDYVGGVYWDNQQKTHAEKQALRDQVNWQYQAQLQNYYNNYASQQY